VLSFDCKVLQGKLNQGLQKFSSCYTSGLLTIVANLFNKVMIIVVARAKKDAKALKHALNEEVLSLGGIRSIEECDFSTFKNRIPIFFFGKEDLSLAEEVKKELYKRNQIFKVVLINKKSVRNARLSELISAFEKAKAELRLGVTFKDSAWCFTALSQEEAGMFKEIHPDYDAYLLIGEGFVKNLKKVFNIDVPQGALILRKLYNQEEVYAPNLKAVLDKKLGSSPKSVYYDPESIGANISIQETIKKNMEFLDLIEKISCEFLREKVEGKRVVVPFSGGKDSTVALLLTKKVIKDVTAIYVKTNFELPYTFDYVIKICDLLKVDLVVKEVKFDLEKFGYPTHENRWCTQLKLSALKETAEKLGASVLVAGDREAESRKRRKRKIHTKRLIEEVYPLKYWSALMVELYLLKNKVPLHPLYLHGFYRLGCSICPSLGEWELKILEFLNS